MSLFLYIRDIEERFKIFSILLYLSFEIFTDIATYLQQ